MIEGVAVKCGKRASRFRMFEGNSQRTDPTLLQFSACGADIKTEPPENLLYSQLPPTRGTDKYITIFSE